eukprot:TRINITY_DN3967_c0_g1_i1.p1 TRINITY_DN3967_c0_g1~~TRINITY_DN3967_c0_g1_i1.p1  ORF type:complete len:876 (+),score=106.92 TRINITY_DN3967_c0_g1_i1:107-2734(+)
MAMQQLLGIQSTEQEERRLRLAEAQKQFNATTAERYGAQYLGTSASLLVDPDDLANKLRWLLRSVVRCTSFVCTRARRLIATTTALQRWWRKVGGRMRALRIAVLENWRRKEVMLREQAHARIQRWLQQGLREKASQGTESYQRFFVSEEFKEVAVHHVYQQRSREHALKVKRWNSSLEADAESELLSDIALLKDGLQQTTRVQERIPLRYRLAENLADLTELRSGRPTLDFGVGSVRTAHLLRAAWQLSEQGKQDDRLAAAAPGDIHGVAKSLSQGWGACASVADTISNTDGGRAKAALLMSPMARRASSAAAQRGSFSGRFSTLERRASLADEDFWRDGLDMTLQFDEDAQSPLLANTLSGLMGEPRRESLSMSCSSVPRRSRHQRSKSLSNTVQSVDVGGLRGRRRRSVGACRARAAEDERRQRPRQQPQQQQAEQVCQLPLTRPRLSRSQTVGSLAVHDQVPGAVSSPMSVPSIDSSRNAISSFAQARFNDTARMLESLADDDDGDGERNVPEEPTPPMRHRLSSSPVLSRSRMLGSRASLCARLDPQRRPDEFVSPLAAGRKLILKAIVAEDDSDSLPSPAPLLQSPPRRQPRDATRVNWGKPQPPQCRAALAQMRRLKVVMTAESAAVVAAVALLGKLAAACTPRSQGKHSPQAPCSSQRRQQRAAVPQWVWYASTRRTKAAKRPPSTQRLEKLAAVPNRRLRRLKGSSAERQRAQLVRAEERENSPGARMCNENESPTVSPRSRKKGRDKRGAKRRQGSTATACVAPLKRLWFSSGDVESHQLAVELQELVPALVKKMEPIAIPECVADDVPSPSGSEASALIQSGSMRFKTKNRHLETCKSFGSAHGHTFSSSQLPRLTSMASRSFM